MPRGDGTGPDGTGAMTGRGAGYCAGFTTPGFANMTPGRGMGMGRGRGRGFNMGMGCGRGWGARAYPATAYPAPYAAAITPQNEVDALKNQARYLNEATEQINRRIAELEVYKKV